MEIIKVGIADDHTMFRCLLKEHLEEYDDIDVVLEAANGNELLEKTEKWKPDVILLDLKMPEMDGFEALDLLKSRFPEIKIIVISMYDEESFRREAEKKGAQAYLLKEAETEVVIKTIRETVKAESAAPLSDKRANGSLTRRQKEILGLLSKGHTAKVIAEKLFISNRTVEDHKDNMVKQFKAKNIAHLISIVAKKGILEFI